MIVHGLFFFSGFFWALTLLSILSRSRDRVAMALFSACTFVAAIVMGTLR